MGEASLPFTAQDTSIDTASVDYCIPKKITYFEGRHGGTKSPDRKKNTHRDLETRCEGVLLTLTLRIIVLKALFDRFIFQQAFSKTDISIGLVSFISSFS